MSHLEVADADKHDNPLLSGAAARGKLYDEIVKTIEQTCGNIDISYTEIVGILEMVKDLVKEEAYAQDDDQET